MFKNTSDFIVNSSTYICICVFIVLPAFNNDAVAGTTIDIKPQNTSAVLKKIATLRCQISGQNSGVVFWKKILPGATVNSGYEALSYDNVSLAPSRYAVKNHYDLVILEVTLQDEGEYACDAGDGVSSSAYLSVIVPMENMTLSWGSTESIVSPTSINLTCVVVNSKPPADIRWFRGTHDVTENAKKIIKSVRSTGFGDTISVLVTTVSPADRDLPFICSADFPDHNGFRHIYLFPNVIGAASNLFSNVFLVGSCLFIICACLA